jgi:hypothetical protein
MVQQIDANLQLSCASWAINSILLTMLVLSFWIVWNYYRNILPAHLGLFVTTGLGSILLLLLLSLAICMSLGVVQVLLLLRMHTLQRGQRKALDRIAMQIDATGRDDPRAFEKQAATAAAAAANRRARQRSMRQTSWSPTNGGQAEGALTAASPGAASPRAENLQAPFPVDASVLEPPVPPPPSSSTGGSDDESLVTFVTSLKEYLKKHDQLPLILGFEVKPALFTSLQVYVGAAVTAVSALLAQLDIK